MGTWVIPCSGRWAALVPTGAAIVSWGDGFSLVLISGFSTSYSFGQISVIQTSVMIRTVFFPQQAFFFLLLFCFCFLITGAKCIVEEKKKKRPISPSLPLPQSSSSGCCMDKIQIRTRT